MASSRLNVRECIGDRGVKLFIREADSADNDVPVRAFLSKNPFILSSED